MVNAKTEIIDLIDAEGSIKCAKVNGHILRIGYSPQDLEEFLSHFEFEYSQWFYGAMSVTGTIWFRDGSWAERDVDAGCCCEDREYWKHMVCPKPGSELGDFE